MQTQACTHLPRPGLLYGSYPQRSNAQRNLWGDAADAVGDFVARTLASAVVRAPAFAARLRAARQADAAKTSPFGARLQILRAQLARHGLTPALTARAHVLIAQAIKDTLGKQPYDTQHEAAWAMLHDRLVEMDTGEGKSLAILISAATAALAGMPVHVVTANDYLAARDAASARPVLARLGLTVAAVSPEMDAAARRTTYSRDVVYCTAREVGFDYLRDQMLKGSAALPVLRGLCLALVDEADSVLIDHARTPLIVAAAASHDAAAGVAALPGRIYAHSAGLREGRDFTLDHAARRADLSADAVGRLHAGLSGLPGWPRDPRIAAHMLAQALVARHLLQRDRHYVVQQRDGTSEIVLIDETTGRTLPGTTWTGGMQQFVALKESCSVPADLRTTQQITLQRLFARYWKLGGISGTLRGSELELFGFYRVGVQRVAPRLRNLRHDLGLRLFGDRERQFDAVLRSAREHSVLGQPVLIGTDNVATSETLAAYLHTAGLAVTVLNAKHDAHEARLIAQAGTQGAITVTTNMAGRGTDIAIDATAARRGLHVIACTLNASRRIDRQLFGRSARNGQPGSCETILSLGDAIFKRWWPQWLCAALTKTSGNRGLPRVVATALARTTQALQSGIDLLQRWRSVQHDQRMQELLAYAQDNRP